MYITSDAMRALEELKSVTGKYGKTADALGKFIATLGELEVKDPTRTTRENAVMFYRAHKDAIDSWLKDVSDRDGVVTGYDEHGFQ